MKKSVKVTAETHAMIEAIGKATGMDYTDVMSLAIREFHDKVIKEKAGRTTTSEGKLLAIWEQLKEYNEVQKEGDKKFFPFPTAYMINKETGINRARDIKPFVEKYATVIEKHHKEIKVDKGYDIHPSLLIKDENGKNIFFQELLRKAGL